MKVGLNKKGEWEQLPDGSPKGIYLDGYIKDKLDKVFYIQKRGWDAMIIIDGKERSGKSMLGMACGWYLSRGTLTMNNFARGIEDTKKKIKELPNKSVLLVDESSLVFNTKESRSKASIELQKILDVVGQKNMIFILILPSVFDLAKSLATRRSLFLLHVFAGENWERGGCGYYGQEDKEVLYVEGKKNYNKYVVNPEFICSFTKFEPPFYEEYLKFKTETLMDALDSNDKGSKSLIRVKERVELWEKRFVNLIKYVLSKTNLTKTEMGSAIDFNIRRINELESRISSKEGGVPTTTFL